MSNPAEQVDERLTSQEALCHEDTSKDQSCSTLKLFIVALSFAYFSKALSGTYMKSSITQIERRFDLSSSHTGLIDGSFEIGNLLFLVAVSHFGAKLHRPRLIGAGCLVMAVGTGLIGLPHFFMGSYKFDTVIQRSVNENGSISPCLEDQKQPAPQETLPIPSLDINASHTRTLHINTGCVKDSQSHMWIYVFLGNALRGIGETPVTPLGISYIDDFAKAENSAFYIACLQTITLLGPMFGFLLGSMCAGLYVDIGFINTDSITITPKDARWVGAWWLGFLVSSAIMLLAGLPFWFFPRSLPKQGEEHMVPPGLPAPHTSKLAGIAKGFLPSLKKLLGTPAYFLLLCGTVLKFNSFVGVFTFKAKYMEQQFGQSASRANFLIGVLNLPTFAVGIFLGGLLMKRYKLSVVSGAQLSFVTSFLAYLLLLPQFGIKCENSQVAGLTVSYNGSTGISYEEHTLFSECNAGCSCSGKEWDPVCSENGITYMSPCLAGCTSSSGFGKNMAFHNCSCVMASPPESGSQTVSLGQCARGSACDRSFAAYMTVSVLSSFINSLGTTPGYMVVIRCIAPELKSLALGIQTLVMRTLGGIPAPVYFGALIDSTCLKWGVKKCGGRGACRMYDSDMYRVIFLGLITCLSGTSYFFAAAVIVLLRKQFQTEEDKTGNPRQSRMDWNSIPPTQRRRQTGLQTKPMDSSRGVDQTNGQGLKEDQSTGYF